MTKMSLGLGNNMRTWKTVHSHPCSPNTLDLCFQELWTQKLMPRVELRTPAGFLRLPLPQVAAEVRWSPGQFDSTFHGSLFPFTGLVELGVQKPLFKSCFVTKLLALRKPLRFWGLHFLISKIRQLINRFLKSSNLYKQWFFSLAINFLAFHPTASDFACLNFRWWFALFNILYFLFCLHLGCQWSQCQRDPWVGG